jgi:tetratricopeptide (TPR) repeat protein
MKRIALNMIVKDDTELDILYRCLNSLRKHVDGLFVTCTKEPYDKIKALVEQFNGSVSYYPWDKSFERARNFALAQIPEDYDYFIWTDSDDVWENAQAIRGIVELMEQRNLTAVQLDYDYDINPQTGKVNITHPRERIMRRGYYQWKAHLHETLIPLRENEQAYFKDIVVKHYPVLASRGKTIYRNLEILEMTYAEEGDNHDPRTEYYLARNYYDVDKYEEAKALFTAYLTHSGWDEERALAHNYLGLVALAQERLEDAVLEFEEAQHEFPPFPAWYANLAYVHALMEHTEVALHYARMFVSTPKPKTSTVYIPLDDEIRYYQTIYMCAMQKRKPEEAYEAARALVELVPDAEEYTKKLESCERLMNLIDMTKGVEFMIKELGEDTDKIAALINALPDAIEDNAYVAQLRQKYLPPKTWEDNSIVYYTGRSMEDWTPNSLKTGIGGSETAVIQLAKKWADLGYKVTVYGTCGAKEGNYDGVEYCNYYRFNRADTFNTIIFWRTPLLLDIPIKAKKILLDMHDVPNPYEFTAERVKKVDTIMVKSAYHRSLLPELPDEKFAIIPNGVDVSVMDVGKKVERNPYKLVYSSSYDRGLESMLRYGWPLLKQLVPEATLDIYYGWNTFDAFFRDNPERQMWKREMKELMSQPGIVEHGRISQKELLKIKAGAAVHWYGCIFEEIDCISVRESALMGCIPFTTDFAVLREKAYCVRAEGDPQDPSTHEALASLIATYLKNPEQFKEVKKFPELAKKDAWTNIAYGWRKYL